MNETLLDLFLTNASEPHVHAGVIGATISDHLPIFMLIDIEEKEQKKKQLRQFSYRDICKKSLEAFQEQINIANWSAVLSKVSADEAYECFLETFCNIYNHVFKYKTHKVNKKCRKPWVTPDILKMMNKKDALYKRFIRTKDISILLSFKQQRNKITSTLRRAKRTYYDSLFQNESRTDVLWKKLNSILHDGHTVEQITKLNIGGEIKNGKALANAFNNYFVDLVHSVHTAEALKYVEGVSDTIFLSPTDEVEVTSVFQCLKNSRSCDIHDIQLKPVKYVIKSIAPILTHIFNVSLQTGVFPRKMQEAKVSVIYKAGDKNDLGNYRPISILPIFSKGLEKIIHKRLSSFCEKQCILTPHQYGFRKGCSTELALLNQKEIILDNIENKRITLAIFIDFSKAFDRLNHRTLLLKLQQYGIRGIAQNIFESYLQFRFQSVVVGGHNSESRKLNAGVPQGSILGPLLFNLYINDITNIGCKESMIIYADDTTILFSGTNISEVMERGNLFLEQLNEWTSLNSLKINSSKTKAMVFRSKGVEFCENQALFLGTCRIEIVQKVKILGVMFNEHIRWDDEVEMIAKKLSKVVGLIYKYRRTLPPSILRLLYNSLFYSCFNYCFLVWGNTTITNIQRLYILQKRVIRILDNKKYDSHTAPLFKKFGIIEITKFYDYKLAMTYKTALGNPENSFVSLASLQSRSPLYSTRHTDVWTVPRSRTNYGDKTIKYQLPRVLNYFVSLGICIERVSRKAIRSLFVSLY